MRRSTILLLTLTSLVFVASVHAGERKKKAPEHHDTVISAVTPAAITITEDKASKTFPITQFTEIDYKGQRASISDLKPGMMVTVALGVDGVSASRINADDPPVHNEHEKKSVRAPKGWMK